MLKLLLPFFAGALICFLLLRTCNDVPQVDTHAIDSLQHAHVADSLKYADSLAVERLARIESDSMRKATEYRFAGIESKMKNQIVSLKFKLSKYRTSVEGRDTVGQLVNCADIVQELDSTYALALAYKAASDSLRSGADARRSLDSAGLVLRDNIIAQLNQQYNAAIAQVRSVLAENAALRVQLSKTKRGRWLIGVLGAVAGGLIVGAVK